MTSTDPVANEYASASGVTLCRETSEPRPHVLRHLHIVRSLDSRDPKNGRAAFELHNAFLEHRLESTLVSSPSAEDGNLLPGTHRFSRAGKLARFSWAALAREASRLASGVDVIHAHGLYTFHNLCFGAEARKQGKCLVYHPHGQFSSPCRRSERWAQLGARILFEERNFRRVRLWRALTDFEADQLRAQGVDAPVVVVPNGIRLERLDNLPGPDHDAKQRLRLLFLAPGAARDAIEHFLNIWGQVAPAAPDWELDIVNPGRSPFDPSLRVRVEALGLNGRVRLFDHLPPKEETSLVKAADLVCVTSASRSFDSACLQALGCSVPLLDYSADTADPNPVTDETWGWRASSSDLRKTLSRAVATSPAERRELGQNGRRLVEQSYSWPVLSRTLLEACQHYCC